MALSQKEIQNPSWAKLKCSSTQHLEERDWRMRHAKPASVSFQDSLGYMVSCLQKQKDQSSHFKTQNKGKSKSSGDHNLTLGRTDAGRLQVRSHPGLRGGILPHNKDKEQQRRQESLHIPLCQHSGMLSQDQKFEGSLGYIVRAFLRNKTTLPRPRQLHKQILQTFQRMEDRKTLTSFYKANVI